MIKGIANNWNREMMVSIREIMVSIKATRLPFYHPLPIALVQLQTDASKKIDGQFKWSNLNVKKYGFNMIGKIIEQYTWNRWAI